MSKKALKTFKKFMSKTEKAIKESGRVIKESVASPEAKRVYKQTWKGAKATVKIGAQIGERHKKASKAYLSKRPMGLDIPSVFEPDYARKVITKAQKRKRKRKR